MMKNYGESVKINHNSNWLYIPDHSYKVLNVGGSGPGKTDVLKKLIKHQRSDIGQIKSFYMSQIYSNRSINYLPMEEKKRE